jgi:hypothetical protein
MPVTSHSRGREVPARSAQKISGRQARHARTQLADRGLPHQEQRRLRAIIRSHEQAARQRRRRQRSLAIALSGFIVAGAIAAVSFGLIPAIEAASGQGATGTFVVSHSVCTVKTGCQWVGTFEQGGGAVTGELAWGGVLPDGDGPGSQLPGRYPGGSTVYAAHGSHTWVMDLLVVLLIGAAAGGGLWLSPLGSGSRAPAGVRASA